MDDSNIETSDYNEASLQIMRLHNLWEATTPAIKTGDYRRWKYILDIVWAELYADVVYMQEKVLHNKSYEKKHLLILKKVASHWNNRTLLYHSLFELHNFLKTIQDDANKGTRRSSKGLEMM